MATGDEVRGARGGCVGILSKFRHRLGLFTAPEALALYVKNNPALPAFYTEGNTTTGGGKDPLDQSFQQYLESPGQFHTVSACIDAIANAAASVPLKVMRDLPGGAEEVEGHPLLDLIANPNPEQGDFSFRFGISQQIGYTGEAVLTTDNPNGMAGLVPGRDELWVLRSDRMKPVPNKGAVREGSEENPLSGWIYDGPGGQVRFTTDRVVQIKRPHPTDPWRGLSPMKQLESVLSIEWHLLRTLRSFLRNGARPSGLYMRRDRPSPEDVERFREQFHDRYGGSENAGKILMLWGQEHSYETLGESLLDENVLSFLEYTKQAIMAVYKVPPFVLASPEGTTWANSREQKQFFYQSAIIPHMELILDTLNASDLVRSYDGGRVYLVADYSGVEAMQPNRKEQAEVDNVYVSAGIMTINEVRANREIGEPVEWGDKPVPSPLAYAYGINPFEYDVDPELAPAAPAGDNPEAEALSFDDTLRRVKRAKAAGEKGEARALRWKAFVRRTQPIERAWVKAVRPLFSEMQAEVMDTFERLSAESKSRKADDRRIPTDWGGEEWFDEGSARDRWDDELSDLAGRTMQTGAEDILKEVNDLFIPFDVDRPEVAQFIDDRMARQIRTILESRQSEVRALVTAAAENGQTVGELEKALRAKFSNDSRVWSMRIARTETAGLYNAGAQAGMEEAEIETKEWLSSRDTSVRETHSAADGTAVPLAGNFTVGDATGPYPGQMSTAAENINCRCTTVPGDF